MDVPPGTLAGASTLVPDGHGSRGSLLALGLHGRTDLDPNVRHRLAGGRLGQTGFLRARI